MPLPLKSHLPIIFAGDLSPVEFEDLCCDVWKCDSEIFRAKRFGRSGQGQRGVDIIAWTQGKQPILGSCKNYTEFDAKKLAKAIGQFWKHRSYWKKKGAIGLVVFVGSQFQDAPSQLELLDYQSQFKDEGLSLELRDNVDITDCLRDNRKIGIKHFPAFVQSFLYGNSTEPITASPSTSSSSLGLSGTLRDNIYLEFTADVEKLLPNLRKKARSGRWSEALVDIENLRSSQHWHLHPDGFDDSLRSKVLILSAALQIDAKHDIPAAKIRIQQAKAADQSGKFQVVESVIALREQGPEKALELLANPESTDAWNIKLSILTDLDRCAEVIAIVANPPFEPNSGTYRVASLAAVVEGDFPEARRFVAMAVAEAPQEFHIRFLAASLQYLEAILPSFKDARFLDWPVPSGWEFVISDDRALAALTASEATFSELLSVVEAENEVKTYLEAWRLACLANHPERQNEAAEYAAELLKQNPCHIPALVWSVERGFPFDHNASKSALLATIQKEGAIAPVQALCTLLIESGDLQAAADQLDRSKTLYNGPNEARIWRHLRVQLAAGLDDDATLSDLLNQEEDPKKRAHLIYASSRVTAAKNKDVPAFIAAANQAYDETGEAHFLLEACDASLAAGDFEFAASHATELLAKLPSPASLFVAVHATVDAGHYSVAIELLSKHSNLVPPGKPGNSLRRLHARCLVQSGDLPKAFSVAKELARSDAGIDSQWMLFSTQVTGADFQGSADTARILVEHPDISSVRLIQIADALRLSDPKLATLAIEKAIEKGVPDAALPGAVSVTFQLGKDDAAGPLLAKMVATADQPESPVKLLGLNEIVEIQQDRMRMADKFFTAYRKGEVPLHFGAEHLNPAVLQMLLGQHPDRSGLDSDGILIRSGNHAVRECEIAAGELFMDLTALLVADQTEILDLAELTFAPILVSALSITSLREAAASIASSQPTMEDSVRQTLALIEEGRIQVVENVESPQETGSPREGQTPVANWACRLSGVATENIGTKSGQTPPQVVLTDHLAALLRSKETISGDPKGPGATLSNPTKTRKQGPFPSDGEVIILESGAAQKLASEGLLSAAAAKFELRIAASERDNLLNRKAESEMRIRNGKQMMLLAERIHRGSSDGRYRFITRDDEIPRPPGEAPPDACTLALYDMSLAYKQGAKFVWCDDRFVNAFTEFESAGIIIGISEILTLLRKRLLLPKDSFFEVLAKLRAQNFRYLPINTEEILWCLGRAMVSENSLTEGDALENLRRYVARCVLDARWFKPPHGGAPANSPMEYRWILDAYQAIAGAVVDLWRDDAASEKERLFKSDYLMHAFFWPLPAAMEIGGFTQNQHFRVYGMACTVATLLSQGFDLDWGKGQDPNLRQHRRAKFNDWVESRYLNPLADVEPTLIESLAKIESEGFEDLRKSFSGPGEKATKLCLISAILDLPEAVKDKIEFRPAFRDWLGIKKGEWQVMIGGVTLNARALWRAIARAAESGEGKIKEMNGERMAVFSRLGKWPPSKKMLIAGEWLPPRGRFTHDALPVITLSRENIRKALGKRSDWFDVSPKERSQMIRRISVERDPATRVEKFLEGRGNSLEWLYMSTEVGLKTRKDLTTDDLLPPTLQSLGNHLRLSKMELSNGNFDLEVCAERLITDVGLARATQRFIQLPIPLPSVLLKEIKSCSESKRKHVLARIERTIKHPLGLIQTAHLFAEIETIESGSMGRASALITKAFGTKEGLDSWTFYQKVLNWSSRIFDSVARFRDADHRLQLLFCWLHAGRVANLFIGTNLDLTKCGDAFDSSARAFGFDVGAWDSKLWDDCMHPRFAQRCPVLTSALASVVGQLPPESAGHLRANAIYGCANDTERDHSQVLLLRDRSLMRNGLGSFLGGRDCPAVREAMTEDLNALMETADPAALWHAALDRIEENPLSSEAWSLLSVILWDLPISEEAERRLHSLIALPEFEELLNSLPDKGAPILQFATARIRLGMDKNFTSRVEDLVSRRLYAHSRSNSSDFKRSDAAHLASCYVGMSVVLGNEEATYAQFFKLLASMVRSWPASGSIFAPPFWSWPNRWPMSRQVGFWEFELTRRAAE